MYELEIEGVAPGTSEGLVADPAGCGAESLVELIVWVTASLTSWGGLHEIHADQTHSDGSQEDWKKASGSAMLTHHLPGLVSRYYHRGLEAPYLDRRRQGTFFHTSP